jgi:16S rRNA (adenine1518-N6/adenine1519-N6)-dimethyltransferase
LKKRYGQHFISDRNLLQRIVQLARISPTDTVIEIGPGSGFAYANWLQWRTGHRVEIDRDLVPDCAPRCPKRRGH